MERRTSPSRTPPSHAGLAVSTNVTSTPPRSSISRNRCFGTARTAIPRGSTGSRGGGRRAEARFSASSTVSVAAPPLPPPPGEPPGAPGGPRPRPGPQPLELLDPGYARLSEGDQDIPHPHAPPLRGTSRNDAVHKDPLFALRSERLRQLRGETLDPQAEPPPPHRPVRDQVL